jgi:hypothetical protein
VAGRRRALLPPARQLQCVAEKKLFEILLASNHHGELDAWQSKTDESEAESVENSQ